MPVAADVAEFVKTTIEALAITSGITPVPVKRRKTPSLPEGQTAPQIVISIGEEGQSDYMDFEETEVISYPVAVTIVTAGGSLEADDDTLRTWLQQIRRAVGRASTWTGFAGIIDVSRSGRAPFDRATLSKDFNYSLQVFTVRIAE